MRPADPLARLRDRLRRRRAGDDGITLIELTVTMAIMSIFMAMFTVAINQMFGAVNRSEAISDAQTQVNTAFERLDRKIRYADAISTPGKVGADHYVEWRTTAAGTAVCTQLRLRPSARQLQWREWQAGIGTPTPSKWLPVASGIVSAAPFSLETGGDYEFQRLRVDVSATGPGGDRALGHSTIVHTAVNSSRDTDSSTICTEGRAIS